MTPFKSGKMTLQIESFMNTCNIDYEDDFLNSHNYAFWAMSTTYFILLFAN